MEGWSSFCEEGEGVEGAAGVEGRKEGRIVESEFQSDWKQMMA